MTHYDYERAITGKDGGGQPNTTTAERAILFALNMRTKKDFFLSSRNEKLAAALEGVWQIPPRYMPTQADLAYETAISERNIRRLIASLQSKGWLHVEAATPAQRRGGFCDRYVLLLPERDSVDAPDTGHGVPEGVETDGHTGHGDRDTGHDVLSTPDMVSPIADMVSGPLTDPSSPDRPSDISPSATQSRSAMRDDHNDALEGEIVDPAAEEAATGVPGNGLDISTFHDLIAAEVDGYRSGERELAERLLMDGRSKGPVVFEIQRRRMAVR